VISESIIKRQSGLKEGAKIKGEREETRFNPLFSPSLARI